MRLPLLALLSLLAAPAAAEGTDANAMLARGPLVLVERNPQGKFHRCTAVALINAPPDKVWEVVTDVGNLKNFVPKVLKSEVVRHEGNEIDLKLEIDTPGVNTRYTMRHTLHPETRTIDITWLEGDLKGSAWSFRLDPAEGGKTLLTYGGASKNFSSVLERLEDDQQTISIGVNVGAALTTVTAIKKRCEAK
jgi:ribosome-associated toxin RatA of RatAB toxin-antitoxin module